jgi:hypothetical protein
MGAIHVSYVSVWHLSKREYVARETQKNLANMLHVGEKRRKNQNDRVLLFPGGKRMRGKLVFVAINVRGGNRVRGGISI